MRAAMVAEYVGVTGDVDDAQLIVPARAISITSSNESSIMRGGWPYFIEGMSLTS